MANPSQVQITGPLKPFASGFAAELARQGYTPGSAEHQLRLMAHLSRWLEAHERDAVGLDPSTIEAFLLARRADGHAKYSTTRALAPLLGHLRSIGAAPPVPEPAAPAGPVETLLARYARYLKTERGLTEESIRRYVGAVGPFLATRARGEVLDLADLDSADVVAFILAASREHLGTATCTGPRAAA